jgi:hypothetical protein
MFYRPYGTKTAGNKRARTALSMAQIVEQLKSYGAAVGTDDVVKAAAYGAAGVSCHGAGALQRRILGDAPHICSYYSNSLKPSCLVKRFINISGA